MAPSANKASPSKPDYEISVYRIEGFGIIATADNRNDPEFPPSKKGKEEDFNELQRRTEEYINKRALRQPMFIKLDGEEKFSRVDVQQFNQSRAGWTYHFNQKGAETTLVLDEPNQSFSGLLYIGKHDPLIINQEKTYNPDGNLSSEEFKAKRKADEYSIKSELEESGLLPSTKQTQNSPNRPNAEKKVSAVERNPMTDLALS